MAVAPLQIPQANINSLADFSPLANLGNIYQKAQDDAQKRSALGRLGEDAGANATALLQSGNPELVQLGLSLQNRMTTQQREDAARLVAQQREDQRYAVTDPRAERQLSIQERQDARAAANDEYDTPEDRAKRARGLGIDPASAEGKEWIINGKWAKKPLTYAEEVAGRRAELEKSGIPLTKPGAEQFILSGSWPKETQKDITATDKKLIDASDDAILGGQAAIASLNRAKILSKNAFEGPTAGGRGYAASFLGDTSALGKSGMDTTNLTNEVTSNALTQLKAIFGAAPTEGERKILLDIQGSVKQPHAVRVAIYDRAIDLANLRMAKERRQAEQLRAGTFFKPGGGMTGPDPAAPATSGKVGDIDWSVEK